MESLFFCELRLARQIVEADSVTRQLYELRGSVAYDDTVLLSRRSLELEELVILPNLRLDQVPKRGVYLLKAEDVGIYSFYQPDDLLRPVLWLAVVLVLEVGKEVVFIAVGQYVEAQQPNPEAV